MQIELSTSVVYVKDFITHKASRDYQALLLKGTRMEQTGELDENGKPKMKFDIDPNNADLANEALVLAMIDRVTDKSEPAKEIEKSRDWLDNLAQSDFILIERAVLTIKNDKESESKK